MVLLQIVVVCDVMLFLDGYVPTSRMFGKLSEHSELFVL